MLSGVCVFCLALETTASMKSKQNLFVNLAWTIVLWNTMLHHTVIAEPCEKGEGFLDFIKDRVHERCSRAWIKNDMEGTA